MFSDGILIAFLALLLPSCFSPVHSSITDENLLRACLKSPKDEHFSFKDECSTDFNQNCGDPVVTPTLLKNTRIVGGKTAKKHSWPWQLSLQYLSDKEWKHLCGASIISKCYAITAAHCVEDYVHQPHLLKLKAGVHNLESSGEGESYEVSKVFTYPLYQGAMTQWDHDIAILKVKPFFKFSANISKICVPLNVPYNRSTVAVTGWGTTTDGGSLSAVLQQVALPVIPWRECANIYKTAINKHKLCAGFLAMGGRDTCQGDSGGPMVTKSNGRFWLSGVTSVGSNCALPDKPGIYTSVPMYRQWILRFLRDSNECLKSSTNQCQQVCVNTPGRYKCECCDGYSLTEGRFCAIECGRPDRSIKSLPSNDQLALADSISHPWLFSLRTTADLSSHRCTATLIASKWLLTAAVCVLDYQGELLGEKNFKVISAPQIPSDGGASKGQDELRQEYEVERILLHYRFNSHVPGLLRDYGVALIKLKTRVTYYTYAKPICLPIDRVKDDQLCMSTGWREAKGLLTKKQVLTSSSARCSRETPQQLTPKQFCAGSNNQWFRTCNQDVGSPLIASINNKAVAVGIVTEKCTPARDKQLYLDLSFFKTWVVEEVNGLRGD